MNNGTIFINAGVGFAKEIIHTRKCPPLTVSMDAAIPVAGLPFTFGLITGYFSEGDNINCMPIAARIAYHHNFTVRNLDTYAVLTLGGIAGLPKEPFWIGLSAGARYFFYKKIGAYAELGFDKAQYITFGMSFKI